jgi:hypothetical protein
VLVQRHGHEAAERRLCGRHLRDCYFRFWPGHRSRTREWGAEAPVQERVSEAARDTSAMFESPRIRAPPGGRRTYNEAARRALVQSCLRPGVWVGDLVEPKGSDSSFL